MKALGEHLDLAEECGTVILLEAAVREVGKGVEQPSAHDVAGGVACVDLDPPVPAEDHQLVVRDHHALLGELVLPLHNGRVQAVGSARRHVSAAPVPRLRPP
jgi:hypothetical protein